MRTTRETGEQQQAGDAAPKPVNAVVIFVGLVLGTAGVACRPSDVLSVPPPAGVTPSSAYQSQAGAEGLLAEGKAQVFQGLTQAGSGVLEWSSVLSDEFRWSYFVYEAFEANVDARATAGTGGFAESGDAAIQLLLNGRLTLLSAIPALEKYESASGRPRIGEAFALMAYAELLAAEDYCGGVTLDALASVQGVQYGTPLTTDSLLAVAEADFDSAGAYAGSDATVAPLAAVGLARTRVDRGRFTAAAAAASEVPTSFVYNAELEPGGFFTGPAPKTFNLYDEQTEVLTCGVLNVADGKGGSGVNFLSAQDPRLVLSTTVAETCDGYHGGSADSVWYYPVKFGRPSTYVPLATGVEARLVEAEAALQAGDANAWTAGLNGLRSAAPATYLVLASAIPPLTSDSTTTAGHVEQVDVMFRERAFWLFGTGTRLGDLRRLIRQYGRDQSTVFPTGPYPNGASVTLPSPLPNYGTDVDLTLPTSAGGLSTPNPNYKGCLVSTKVA